jgi:hypothetical protein
MVLAGGGLLQQPRMMTSWCRTFLIVIQSLRWPGWQAEARYPLTTDHDQLSGKGDYVNRALAARSRLRAG